MTFIDMIAWIRLEDGKILSTRSRGKDVYYIPGSKREPGEADIQTLVRERGCRIHRGLQIRHEDDGTRTAALDETEWRRRIHWSHSASCLAIASSLSSGTTDSSTRTPRDRQGYLIVVTVWPGAEATVQVPDVRPVTGPAPDIPGRRPSANRCGTQVGRIRPRSGAGGPGPGRAPFGGDRGGKN
jgi:hypothetical protein